MCGIVAIVGRHGQLVPRTSIGAAAAALAHRGPDDSGEFHSENIALGFRRLAIIDLTTAGHQPMSTPDGALTIVFNGEIYNYLELRSELLSLGHRFHTASDTEVLLTAYQQWGADCVHHFNGMWAFVIHDRRLRTLFGSRDRLGVKPLYVWQNSDWLVLASEPKAIGASGLLDLSPKWSRLADSIAWDRMDHGDDTCIADIYRIPAGHRFWVNDSGSLKTEQFWQLPPENPGASVIPEAEWVARLGALATDAVRIRLRSDVPVGFTLSGGLDSTLLLCEAARLGTNGDGIVAFSYQDSRYDETRQIKDTLSQTGARLIALRDDELDSAAMLPEIIAAHGEPVHSLSATAGYALFKLAKRHGIKVVLGGQGADEVLCGYPSFQVDYWYSLASDRRWRALTQDVGAFAKLHDQSEVTTLLTTLVRALRITVGGTEVYRRLANSVGSAYPRNTTTNLFSPELLRLSTPPRPTRNEYRIGAAQRSSVSRWPLPLYLRIEDRNSMAHSVEARLPFTDYRLVEHALRMPDQLKHAGGLNKIALRKIAARRLPPSVVSRIDKFGFPVSTSATKGRKLHTLCSELAASRQFRERGIYSLPAVRKLLADFRGDEPSHVSAIFDLAQCELWLGDIRHRHVVPANGRAVT